MLLINCKTELSLKWIENCVLTTPPTGANANAAGADRATSEVTDAKLHVSNVITLSRQSEISKTIKQTI